MLLFKQAVRVFLQNKRGYTKLLEEHSESVQLAAGKMDRGSARMHLWV